MEPTYYATEQYTPAHPATQLVHTNAPVQAQVVDLLEAGLPVEHPLPQGNELKFILAGNAVFTVRSQKTGTRFTFKVQRAKAQEGQLPPDRWFVKLLNGPMNTGDYTYMGMIDNGKFLWTKASKVSMQAPSFKAFQWVCTQLVNGFALHNCEVWHAGHCGRCGRLLTVPQSIELGLGPDCADKGGF